MTRYRYTVTRVLLVISSKVVCCRGAVPDSVCAGRAPCSPVRVFNLFQGELSSSCPNTNRYFTISVRVCASAHAHILTVGTCYRFLFLSVVTEYLNRHIRWIIIVRKKWLHLRINVGMNYTVDTLYGQKHFAEPAMTLYLNL